MRWIATAIGLLALCLPGIGRAEPGTGVVIVSVGSKIEQHDRLLAISAAEERVRANGWQLSPKTFSPREVDAIMGCFLSAEAWSCVAKIVRDQGIQRIAAVTLGLKEAADGSRQVVVGERLAFANAESILVGQRFCEHCTDDTLTTLTGELTKELLDRASLRSGRTVLSIRSTPQRAKYFIDGSLMGITDAKLDVLPGKHTVTIEHDGFESITRSIQAEEGKTAEVSVTLDRVVPSGPRDPVIPAPLTRDLPAPHSRLLPVTLLVAGGLAIAGGGVLITLNQHSVTKGRGEEQPQGYYSTVGSGIAVVGGGILVASLGGYLWWKYSRAEVAPTMTATTGGAVVGILKAF